MFVDRYLVKFVLTMTGLLFVSGCAPISGTKSDAQIISEYNKYQSIYKQETQYLLAQYKQTGQVDLRSAELKLSPLNAAIVEEPALVPEMIAKGADVNYRTPVDVLGLYLHSPLNEVLLNYREQASQQETLDMIERLLEAGADPNQPTESGFGSSICELKTPYYGLVTKQTNIEIIERAALLLRYGADPTGDCTEFARTAIKDFAKRDQRFVPLSDFLEAAQRVGIDQALATATLIEEDRIREEAKRKAVEAERRRQQEIEKQVAREKRVIIEQSFAQDTDLKAAISSLREFAAPCLSTINARGKTQNVSCGAIVRGNNFWSESCENYQKEVVAVIDRHENQVCPPYFNLRDRFANAFGDNSEIAKDVIWDLLADARDSDIDNHYGAERNRIRSIRDRDARQERAASQRAEQQGLYNLMRYAESSFGSNTAADHLIEQGVRDTQRTLQAIGNNRRMAEINADLDSINKRLEAIDQSTASNTNGDSANIGMTGSQGSNKVCAGPFTRPVTVSVVQGASSPRRPSLECPSGTTPIAAGSASSPNYLQGSWQIRKLSDGTREFTLAAWDYECLCHSGNSQGTGSYQQ